MGTIPLGKSLMPQRQKDVNKFLQKNLLSDPGRKYPVNHTQMSKLTVPQHITHSTLFRNWLEAINGIIDEELELYDLLESKAPKNHASQSRAFGLGNEELYGHLRLTDTPDHALDVSSGTACSPAAVLDLTDAISLRIDQLEEDFYARLQDLRTELQEQITELQEEMQGKAPIYHASPDTTYGKGNAVLYGHLKLSSARSPRYGVDDGTAATPSAVQSAYDDAIAYVDALNIDTRFEEVSNAIADVERDVDALEDRMDAAEESIEDIASKMTGLNVLVFSESIEIGSDKSQYGTYVFRDAPAPAAAVLGSCADNIRISFANETARTLSIVPAPGHCINMAMEPVVLGRGDSASFVQNPPAGDGTVNWSLTGRHSVLETASETSGESVVDVNMASEKAQYIEVSGSCALNFILGDANEAGRTEYAEKTLFLVALNSNCRVSYPEGVIWTNSYEAPEWGKATGEMLMLKAYQFGERILLEEKHNSHIVPGLEPRLINRI